MAHKLHSSINSTMQGDDNVWTQRSPVPFFVAFSGAIVLSFMMCLVKVRRRHRQAQRDVMAAKPKSKDMISLQALNDASPSQKYEVRDLGRQATGASTYASSAEVCAICLEVLVDRDDVRRLQCQHVFHSSCIDSWFQNRHVDCPLCKSVFILNRQDDLRLEVR
ncbi:Uncharacterized protein HZ326_26368 [Fusarium oxysporum f. sp. albedinis]|nr:Uncharacterized protein HZ326_26368 [Fusarium oxysporum f. sp. albedinis]